MRRGRTRPGGAERSDTSPRLSIRETGRFLKMQRRPATLTRPGRLHFHLPGSHHKQIVNLALTARHTREIVRPMQTASIPSIDIRPDLFGNLAIDVTCEGTDPTPNGVLRWLSQHAQTNYHFRPSIRSIDLAERFGISRRTLEAYRTGMKVPVTLTWKLKVLLDEIRSNASGLVPCSTPSETATRESAPETPSIPGLDTTTPTPKKKSPPSQADWEDAHQNPTRLSKAIKAPIKRTATNKNKTSKTKSKPSKPQSPPSSKSRNPSSTKSKPSSKKSRPSLKSRKPSKK